MAALGMMAEAANARLLHERVESVREQLAQLQNQVERYDAVAETLTELPRRLSHLVMVPLGKRAMAPGKIVRSNDVLAHLGDDVFSWRLAMQAVEIIARKRTHPPSVAQLRKTYEAENIREIQETEAASELGPVPRATEDDIKEYFEV
ncbi:hypothetical protein PF005_g2949 [Phytophthora fragariae]|uniref:Uncharacterized protein n=2 Tax=Phytophthora fragariae TaxID=53985 RepID=A0A6A3ZB38_9STRA|nr:hypothetical protein PF003_g4507 [Phytophthora fragariae]KAE9151069.1 hypothetical protein PF006_g4590 [Phytophthora fragariae]KAE9231854.1 hypothetical protein PF005_g2949 [Phytophthora fragariae]KAE9326052.1 hypothetical protein PF001_g2637 [Phytophthora fragariae]